MHDLPVGFRFYPTEEELVSFYLPNKLKGTKPDIDRVIPVVDIYDYNPWDLPQFAGERCPQDSEQWFFFTPRQEREARGGRPNRLTKKGYWKATGSPGDVTSSSSNQRIGKKRTMVFYEGRAPNGEKTVWKMNEYKVFDYDNNIDLQQTSSSPNADLQVREELSLCRLYKRSKCLRSAFDRRPAPPAMVVAGDQAVAHHHEHQATEAITISNNNQHENPAPVSPVQEINMIVNNSAAVVDGAASSSGDHTTNPSQSVESDQNNWEILMATDHDEPLWDWDDFNWFDV